jgi:hypothetical protein
VNGVGGDANKLFEKDYIDALQPTTIENPRRLVKVFHAAVSQILTTRKRLSNAELTATEQMIYSGEST